LCGYTKKAWDRDQDVPIDDLSWDDVPEKQQEALCLLGYTQETWDESDCDDSCDSDTSSSHEEGVLSFAGAPVHPMIAAGFLAALREEYVHSVDCAVGKYFDLCPEDMLPRKCDDMLESCFEQRVRDAEDPEVEIDLIAQEWRVGTEVEAHDEDAWDPEWDDVLSDVSTYGFEFSEEELKSVICKHGGDHRSAVKELVLSEREQRE